jgi:hypothetical protein
LSVTRPGTFDYKLYWEEDGYGFTGSIGHFSIAPKLEINNMV